MENTIIGIFGYRGSGKTALLALLAYCEYIQRKKILTNVPFYNIEYEVLNPDDLVNLKKDLVGCTIFISEIHNIADSRLSANKQNRQVANFFLQSRKRGVNVVYDDQYANQVEKRIRENTDIKIVATNLHIDSDKDGIDDMFEYVIVDLRNTDEHSMVKRVVLYMKPVFGMYDSDHIINVYEYYREKSKKKV